VKPNKKNGGKKWPMGDTNHKKMALIDLSHAMRCKCCKDGILSLSPLSGCFLPPLLPLPTHLSFYDAANRKQ